MPHANIWIRKEDWKAWQNISDKPGWIHDGLTSGLVTIPPRGLKPPPIKRAAAKKIDPAWVATDLRIDASKGTAVTSALAPPVATALPGPVATAAPGNVVSTADIIKKRLYPEISGTCKVHGIPLTAQGKCLQKGCKYA